MQIYFLVLAGIVGLCIGSFLNVVAIRLLSETSFAKGRSKCPKCESLIKWYDNIPVLSFILLRGKCRNCGNKISFQYPLVEIITGGLFVATVFMFGVTLKTLFLLILISNLIVITITDLKEQYIFDINSVPIIPIGLIYNFFDIGNTSLSTVKFMGLSFNEVFVSALIGAIVGAAFFEIFSRLGLLIVGEYAFGSGDSVLAAALGAWFGWKAMVVIIVLSFVCQMIIGIPVILYNMIKADDKKSLWAMLALAFGMGFVFWGRYLTEHGEFQISLALIIIAFILTGGAIFVILKQTRERQSHTFLPFGPALVLAGLLIMFFSQTFMGFFFIN
jgi:leader peptidase (prepilin peptidase)/N-methyltransferase